MKVIKTNSSRKSLHLLKSVYGLRVFMTHILIYIIHTLFVTYTVLLFLRVISFWFPVWQAHQIVRFLAFYTDPYLQFFRRFIPPIGGVLDLSPILAFLILRLLESFLLGLLRWIF